MINMQMCLRCNITKIEFPILHEKDVCAREGGSLEDRVALGQEQELANRSWRIPMDRGPWQAIVHGIAKSWTQLSD